MIRICHKQHYYNILVIYYLLVTTDINQAIRLVVSYIYEDIIVNYKLAYYYYTIIIIIL